MTYFIQHSEDLLTWEYLPLIEPGAGQAIEWGFTSTGEKFFVRLRYSDIATSDPFNDDFDGDGVGNMDELVRGTDPFFASDQDGDGRADDLEIAEGSDPAKKDHPTVKLQVSVIAR